MRRHTSGAWRCGTGPSRIAATARASRDLRGERDCGGASDGGRCRSEGDEWAVVVKLAMRRRRAAVRLTWTPGSRGARAGRTRGEMGIPHFAGFRSGDPLIPELLKEGFESSLTLTTGNKIELTRAHLVMCSTLAHPHHKTRKLKESYITHTICGGLLDEREALSITATPSLRHTFNSYPCSRAALETIKT
jgi:hypothetical protein